MSKVKEFLANVDRGFYQKARVEGVSAGALLAKEVEPQPDQVAPVCARILKRFGAEDNGSYQARALHEFAEQVAALELCLAERGIRKTDRAEKFFSSANDTALFPAFMATEIIAGQLAASLVPVLAAMDQRIDSHVAEKLTASDTADDRTLKFTGEGAAMPKTKVSTAEGQVKLYKYGRVLEWTYESARLQTLDVIGNFLQRLGVQIGIDETDDLIEVLITGDGTTSSVVTDTNADVSGTLDYDEWIKLYQSFPVGYKGAEAVINDTNLRTTLNLAEFKDPLAGFNIASQGIGAPVIFGMRTHRWTSTGSTSFSTDRILAVDPRYAVKVLREGDFLDEADRIIDRQLNQRAMSEWVGYMKLDNNATQCLDITA